MGLELKFETDTFLLGEEYAELSQKQVEFEFDLSQKLTSKLGKPPEDDFWDRKTDFRKR